MGRSNDRVLFPAGLYRDDRPLPRKVSSRFVVLEDRRVSQLPEDVRASYRFFAFYLANGTLCLDLLDGIDYRPALMAHGSALEQVMAIFSNVLDVDEAGHVTNAGDAEWRAAQYIRRLCDPAYTVSPPFEERELDLPM